jgi:TRAP-type mannitol/chloroaromatic compound transport system permease small subunit
MFNKLATAIDTLNLVIGKFVAWLTLFMAIVMFVTVILRYVFNLGWVWMQDSVVFMHGFIFMLAAGATLLADEHVRIDIIYRPLSEKKKAIINIIGTLCLLFPTCFVIFYYAYPYVIDSWSIFEPSSETGGLPGVFLLKSAVLALPTLLALQGLSKIIRAVQTLNEPN